MKKLGLLIAFCLVTVAHPQGWDPSNWKDLQWTNVGPNRGGRSVAVAGVRKRVTEFYFGATGGGVWKSSDSGETWACVSDGFFKTSSVGALAVSESNPDIVWAGMGERDIRGNISEGDGVYKSTDGGKTWSHMGLQATRTISRILIDPQNPEIVYVAALGPVYGASSERGVFKSVDGGKTWTKILYATEKAGAVELVFDPSNSKTLYAATWDAWRTPYFLNSGGPNSKLWKSTDAGATWSDISRNPGMPTGTLGKIGVSVSAANPKVVYSIVEALDGGIFRSEDAGATWTKVNSDNQWRQRAWYYTHIYADPKDANKVYCLNVGMGRSADGGKTWQGVNTPHSDNHDLWINPDAPDIMIEANDGGASVSLDGGRRWTRQDYPTAQLYHVSADNAIPYRILGAQQDNSSVRVDQSVQDSREKRNFISTAGGESGYVVAKPDDPDVIYGGNYSGDLEVVNHRTNLRKAIDPWPLNPMGHGAIDLVQRFQWTYPIVFSPHDPNVLYTCSQYVLRTTNDGQSWEKISPDLTRNDPKTLQSSGGPITQDNTGVEYYGTVFTLAESPVRKGVLWAGSDDGLVHVTLNGGKSWSNVTPKDLPAYARISMIDASPHEAGVAYVAANNYQNNDLGVYIYRTFDYGKTWSRITKGIPAGSFARVCRSDPRRAGLLYAGTETGVFVSFDEGDNWQPLQQNLPVTPIHDLVLKDDDLVAATHGRSFWIMRNVDKLANLTPGKIAAPLLYQPWPQTRLGTSARAEIHYYIPAAVKDVSFTFLDAKGRSVGSAKGDASAGYHTLTASLAAPGFGTFPGMIFWSGFPRPLPVPPGTYQVRMVVDGVQQNKNLLLTRDPRIPATEAELVGQYEFSLLVNERVNAANQAVLRIRDMKTQIAAASSDQKADTEVKTVGEALRDQLTAVEGEIYQYRSRSGQDPLNYPIKLNNQLAALIGFVQSGARGVPQQARDVFELLNRQLTVQLNALAAIERRELGAYNSLLRRKGLPAVTPKNPPLQQGGARRFSDGEEGERDRG